MSSPDAQFQKRIVERDQLCLKCLRGGEGLAAHHLIGRRYKASRHDDRNGVAVCAACHAWAHKNTTTSEEFFVKKLIENGVLASSSAWDDFRRSVLIGL